MSCRVDSTLIAGACVVGVRGLGVLGSVILATTATGTHGPGYLYNELTTADNAKEIQGLIVTPPASGTFLANEDGSFSLTGAADGTYSFTYRVFADGADLGTSTGTITIGTASPATATTLSGPATGTVGIASSSFSVGTNGAISGTITITPSDSGNGGVFTPATVTLTAGAPTATFTYTAASAGTKTISISDNGALTDATPRSFVATAISDAGILLFNSNPADVCRAFGSGMPILNTNATMWVHDPSTGALVTTLSVATDADGLFGVVSHADLEFNTNYRIDYKFSSGEYGVVYRATEAA